MMPEVSVIVPAYNAQKYVGKCIHSICNQTMDAIEVLLVDDGSTDETLHIMHQYADMDSRIRVYSQPNEGVSAARNTGIQKANGKWLMFVDADDWLSSDAIKTLHQRVRETDVELVMCDFYREEGMHSVPDSFFVVDTFEVGKQHRDHFEMNCLYPCGTGNPSSSANLGVPWAKLYRASLVHAHKLRFPVGVKRMQDTLFNLEYIQRTNRFVYIKIPLYHYRIWSGSACSQYTPDFLSVAQELIERMWAFADTYKKGVQFYNILFVKTVHLLYETIRRQYLHTQCALPLQEIADQVSEIAMGSPFAEAIQSVPKSLMPRTQRAGLWLLRHGQYRILCRLLAFREKQKAGKSIMKRNHTRAHME